MDLQGFLAKLREFDQLRFPAGKVRCDLELAALCRREFQQQTGGKALYFNQLVGYSMPVAANLFGSEVRLAAMLRCCTLQQLADRIRALLQRGKGSAAERLGFAGASRVPVPLQQSLLQPTSTPDLYRFPTIRSWPGEAGGYLTLALAVTRDPETGAQNVGLYRAQVLAADLLALNFAPGSGADQHLQAAAKLNQPLPVALVLGSDPAYLWAAAAPLPRGCDEFTFCTELVGSNSSFISCVSQDLQVPADAELVIEGQIDPGQTCREGPFGNHTGQYVSRTDCPLLRVTAVLQKPEPVIPVTVVGPPPSENIFLGKANELLLREMLLIDFPQVRDLQMPLETIFHGASMLAVAAQSRSDNRELIDNLWKSSPLRRAKVMILLDEDIDLKSLSQCWWRTINMLDPGKIYQDAGRIAIDATGVDPATLVMENQQTIELMQQRHPNDEP
jgi:4-hydroxy-3-polyprenylbenzoate decarboxylase